MVKDGSKAIIGLGLLTVVAGVVIAATKKAKAVPPPEPIPGFANLYGTVTDVLTATPLKGVTVELWMPDRSELLTFITTDKNGYYSIMNIVPGNYLVSFAKEGYEPEVR